MALDAFDIEFLENSGDPQDVMKSIGVAVGENNASKYITGINHYLSYKEALRSDRDIGEMEEVIVKADGTQTTKRLLLLSEEEKQDPQKIMNLMGYDPLQWKLVSCKTRRNYWDVTIKNKAREGVKHTNHAYMCTITVKPIQKILTTDFISKVFDDLKPPKLESISYSGQGKMLELPIMDLHLGKLAWKDETGENYDLKIAEKLYKDTILDILASIESYQIPIERIVFPIGQDFYHFDSDKVTTSAGTPMDTDTRWQKMYRKGVELLLWAFEHFRHIAPVEGMYVAGNHDKMLSYCATVTMNAYYSEVNSVKIDLSPTPRKYIHYGINLIGFSHGKEERKRIEHLMQVEQPEAWANSIYREWHLGDLHHERAREKGGVIIRRVSSITGQDAWHEAKGFKGAIRKAQAFIWDKKLGKELTIDSNVRMKI